MATKASNANKGAKKSLFTFKKTSNASSADPPESNPPTDSTSTGDPRGILNTKDGLHNFGVALELLKCVGEGNDFLAPLKAVCGGLKVLVDTAEAIQQNKEDLRDLNSRLRRQLDALEQQDEMLSTSDSKVVQKDVERFVRSLTTYILDLNKVQNILDTLKDKDAGRAKRFFKKTLMVYSIREDINDCNRQLDESFQLFTTSVTSFIAQQAVLLRKDIVKMQMGADEKKANDALAQLPCSDARGNQHDCCLEGTREDILKQITEWATNAAEKPIFCLVDQAGTGKSTISAHMAQKWEKEGVLIGRFFFSLPNSITNANDLPTTLARDMANTGPLLRSLILDAINDHPNIAGHSIEEKLEWFVFTPLRRWRDSFIKGLEQVRRGAEEKAYSQGPENIHPEIAERLDIKGLEGSYYQALEQARKETEDGPCKELLEQAYLAYTQGMENAYVETLARAPIVIVDALDECAIVDRGTLLKFILSFLEEASLAHTHPIKVFLTCRPERDILSHIQGPHSNRLVRQVDFGLRLEENPTDIRLYANKYLDQVLSTAEIDLFVIRADSLFIWAATARTFLADAFDPSARFKELLAPNTKSSPLDSLYDKVLRSAIERAGHDQVGLLKNVLQGVCVAREPLSTCAMDELLGLSKGVARRVVNTLRSVLSDGTDDKAVQALYPTFIEYLRAGSQPRDFLFCDREAETLLAGGCLDVLSSPQLRFDICGVMGPDRFAPKNKDIEDLQQRLEQNAGAGLRYAAVHGLSHVALCLGNRTVLMRLREFFTSKLLYWIELMSLIGRVYHLMQLIHHLKSQIEDGMRQSMELLSMSNKDWCEEIQKLVQPFQAVIEESALQVYFSALPFAPSASQISHTYHRSMVDRIPKVLHGALRVQSQYTALAGHGHAVNCVAFSPDGQRIASGSKDATLRLWDATTGAAVGEPLSGHTYAVTCLSFSPDGRILASGSGDTTIRLWDSTTGTAVGEPLTGHTYAVTCLSFSPDGRKLASGSSDKTIRLWDSTTGAAVGEPLIAHTGVVASLSFSPDGRTLASGSSDRTVRLWDATTGAAIDKPLAGHTGAVLSVSFSPDVRILASVSEDKTIRLWDSTTGTAIGEPLTGHTDTVTCLSFSPDGRKFASGSYDRTVRLWDAITGAAVDKLLTGHANTVTCLSFSPDGRILASGSSDKTIRLWDSTAGAAIGEPLTGHNGQVSSLSFSPDGRTLASGSSDRTVRLWDAITDAAVDKPLTCHTSWVSCLSFSPDGRKLASGSCDYTIRLWDSTTGAAVGEPLTGHTDQVSCLSFSPDGRKLASGSWDFTIRLWDAITGAAVDKLLIGHANIVTCLSFSPDGRILASGSRDKTIRRWDSTTGIAVGEPLTGHNGKIRSLSFSPDGRNLASGSSDRTVRLWDAITDAAVDKPLTCHTSWVSCLSFSPDGRKLASGSYDRTVRLWDATTGATIGEPVWDESFVETLSFHTHDQSLLLVVNGGSAIWKLCEDVLVKLDFEQQPPELIIPHSKSLIFEDPWTYVQSSTGFRFRLPPSFQCREFASHGGILAYGGVDGSVIIVDCSHLI